LKYLPTESEMNRFLKLTLTWEKHLPKSMKIIYTHHPAVKS